MIYLVAAGAVPMFSSVSFAQAPRFAQLTLEETAGEQRALAERMMKETRAGLGGPWNVMLRSPGMADGVLDLYNYYRRKTSLTPQQIEFGIMITAREWNAKYEWFAHYPHAMAAGISPAILADLRIGKRPPAMSAEQSAEYDFTTELLRRHEVSDATFRRGYDALGQKGVVDLTGLVGTYITIGALINISQVPVKVASKDAPEYLPESTRYLKDLFSRETRSNR
ncbi:MAG: carboxymuconolactone decarboxylase family protein [Acidobacteriota bacterium]|nr:carboxymuconolactone decarboxylase family protein [Acidobacteriota bacterium]